MSGNGLFHDKHFGARVFPKVFLLVIVIRISLRFARISVIIVIIKLSEGGAIYKSRCHDESYNDSGKRVVSPSSGPTSFCPTFVLAGISPYYN